MTPTDPTPESRQPNEQAKLLEAEFNSFLERFDASPRDPDAGISFYTDAELGPVMEQRLGIDGGHTVVIKKPAILSEVDDETEEPDPASLPFVFEMSTIGRSHPDLPDWVIALNADYSLDITSRHDYRPETIIDAAIKTLRDLA